MIGVPIAALRRNHLDVSPQRIYNNRSRLRVNAKKTCQPNIQFVLWRLKKKKIKPSANTIIAKRYLVVKHEKDCTFNRFISFSTQLKPVRLVNLRGTMPLRNERSVTRQEILLSHLHQMVIRTVHVLIYFDHDIFEERRKFARWSRLGFCRCRSRRRCRSPFSWSSSRF